LLSRQLAHAPDGLAGLSCSALGGLLVGAATSQFAKEAFALELPLEQLQRLIDIVVADEDLDDGSPSWGLIGRPDRAARRGRRRASGYRCKS
jgi:hypothetical protein